MGHQIDGGSAVFEVRKLYGISTGTQMSPYYTLATEPLTMLFQHNLKYGKERCRTLADNVHETILTDSGLHRRTVRMLTLPFTSFMMGGKSFHSLLASSSTMQWKCHISFTKL